MSTAVNMTAERDLSLGRQAERLFEQRARSLLASAGWSAGRAALEEVAREQLPDTNPERRRLIVRWAMVLQLEAAAEAKLATAQAMANTVAAPEVRNAAEPDPAPPPWFEMRRDGCTVRVWDGRNWRLEIVGGKTLVIGVMWDVMLG